MFLIKIFFRLILILTIPLAVALGTYWYLSTALMGPVDPSDKSKRIVEIAPGSGFSEIAGNLEKNGLLKYDWSLTLLAKFKKEDTKIKAGEYEFSPSMPPREILAKLLSGKMLIRKVLVKEGATLADIAKSVQEAGVIQGLDFLKAVQDPQLLAKAGVAADSFEGYLYPETYNFSRPITAEQVIWRMFSEGEKRWRPEYQAQAERLKLSRQEILTLASIIEKESGSREEQPLVASVFYNRISQGIRLQSDPTVIYGIKDFDGNLTKADLQNPQPYNTYINFGLPPGPIANPGETAINAALFPAETEFIFFVGDNQGKHIFSKTLAEHNAAVLKYQKQGFGREKEDGLQTAGASIAAVPSTIIPPTALALPSKTPKAVVNTKAKESITFRIENNPSEHSNQPH